MEFPEENDVTKTKITTKTNTDPSANVENGGVQLPVNIVRAKAFKSIRQECARIDAEMADTPRHSPRRVVEKLNVYADILERNGMKPPSDEFGNILPSAFSVIGHHKIKRTPEIALALTELAARFGIKARMRHDPETAIDIALDRYEEVVAERGYGPPRAGRGRNTNVSKEALAAELGCDRSELDEIAMNRVGRIAASAAQPGPIHYSANASYGNSRRAPNAALAPMLAASLARFDGKLPQDPLDPTRVDLITVAEDAGIAVNDIRASTVLRNMVEQARAGKALVEHPVIEQRRYTVDDLIKSGREQIRVETPVNAGDESRQGVFAFRKFMELEELGASDTVPHDLARRIQKAVANARPGMPTGWRARLEKWIGYNDALRATKPMPSNFGLTLAILCREAGLTPAELQAQTGGLSGNIRVWVNGEIIPSAAAEPMLERLAEVFRTPLSVIKRDIDDDWRKRRYNLEQYGFLSSNLTRQLPFDFEKLSKADRIAKLEQAYWTYICQDTEYARGLSARTQDEYALPYSEWPTSMQDAWQTHLPVPEAKRSPLRRLGEAPVLKGEGEAEKDERKWREATIAIRRETMSQALGYWSRPRRVDELQIANSGLKTDYTPEAGLGIPRELLSPGCAALTDLTLSFCHWRMRRSGSLNRTVPLTLLVISSFLRPKTGVVWQNPALLADLERLKEWWDANPHDDADGPIELDLEPFRQDWHKAVERAYDVMRGDLEDIRKSGQLVSTRDTFLPVGVYVQHDRPMELYMRSVVSMLRSRPHAIISRHVHTRDCVNALILVQTGLRTHNMRFTFDDGDGLPDKRARGRDGKVLEPTLRRTMVEGSVRWTVKIPASEFKNWYSPYFSEGQPYEKVLGDQHGLYDLLEEYVTKARVYMLKGRKSDYFFISSAGRDMDEHSLGHNYSRLTSIHFIQNDETGSDGVPGAMPHGMHAVRNVIATHVVKVTGDLDLAAWAIQDSYSTVRKHYARFIPRDKVALVDKVLSAARLAVAL